MHKRVRGGALLMLLLMLLAPWGAAVPDVLHNSPDPASSIGTVETVVIGASSGGIDDRLSVDVDDGRSIARIDLAMESAALGRSTGATWSGPSAWNASGVVYDGIDVNGSALRILPTGAFWDFEDPAHGWTLGGSNVWMVGYDTSLGQVGGVHSGSSALYTYNGNYPNYMSQFWATSPTMDCSGCSGSWSLNYMRRLGVESSSWDHAYVQVKNAQGTWVNIWSNGGTMNEGSFTSITHDISSYIAGNSAFAVRFGLGTSDGSVTYTGWNLDDVRIEPTGGVTGTGEGDWTSAPFQAEMDGAPHARLHLDAELPDGASFVLNLLDATTGQPVPGFTDLQTTSLDLGALDADKHPLLRLHLALEEGPEGGPRIGAIAFGGRLLHGLDVSPLHGWEDGAGNTASDAGTFNAASATYSSSSTLTGPLLTHRSGIGALRNLGTLSGGLLEVRLDGGNWTELADGGGMVALEDIAHTAQFRIGPETAGGSWVLSEFQVDLLPSPAPERPMVDVSSDGAGEWGLVEVEHGRLGFQDRFSNGERWIEGTMVSGGRVSASTYLPASGLEQFGLMVDFLSGSADWLNLELQVDGTTVVGPVNMTSALHDGEYLLPSVDRNLLLNALSGLRHSGPQGLDLVEVDVVVSGPSSANGVVVLGGIMAPYEARLEATLTAGHPLVVALNGALGEVTPINGVRTLAIPVSLAAPGALRISVEELRTTASVEVVDVDFTPDVMTLVPGAEWYEMNATFDATSLGSTSFLADMVTQGWTVRMVLHAPGGAAVVECPVSSLPLSGTGMNGCTQTGMALEWWSSERSGGMEAGGAGTEAWVSTTFRMPVGWGDEPSAVLSVSLVSPSGPMLPASRSFGLGSTAGISNTIGVTDWWVSTSTGFHAHPEEGWLAPGDEATVEVDLGFSEAEVAAAPRPGDLMVRARVNGVEIGTESLVINGHATFDFTVPSFVPDVEIRIDLEPLKGQDRYDVVDTSATYALDGVAPLLLGRSTESMAHMPASRDHAHHVLVGDRPSLPSRGEVHLWRSWQDDLNGDGSPASNEVHVSPLSVPEDLSYLQGEYGFVLDASRARPGDWYAFWYRLADPAGNPLEGAGNLTHPMTVVQVAADAAPSTGSASTATWSTPSPTWLHPDEHVVLSVPVGDANGVGDIASVLVDLDLEKDDDLKIRWTPSQGCVESHRFLTVHACTLVAQEDGPDPFHAEGVLQVSMSIEWGFDPDASAVRTPSVTVADRGGQFTSDRMDELAWRASSEVSLDMASVVVRSNGEVIPPGQAQVRPGVPLSMNAGLMWIHSGRSVDQPLLLEARLDDVRVNATLVDGLAHFELTAPTRSGSHGVLVDVLEAPDGLVLRGSEGFARRFMVDVAPPTLSAITSPQMGVILAEEDWSSVVVDVRANEDVGLGDVALGWRVMVSGFGLAGEVVANGTVPMELRGARNAGDGLPLRATLDLEASIPEFYRSQRLELRIWILGSDLSGQPFSTDGNAPTDPYGIWLLEQRVPVFAFAGEGPEEQLRDASVGGAIDYNYAVVNHGRTAGDVQMLVEVVAADGTRTRIDARSLAVASGETEEHAGTWVPLAPGPVRFEYILVDGTTVVGDTHLIDEAAASGLLGAATGGLGGIMMVLSVVALLGVAAFRLARRPPSP